MEIIPPFVELIDTVTAFLRVLVQKRWQKPSVCNELITLKATFPEVIDDRIYRGGMLCLSTENPATHLQIQFNYRREIETGMAMVKVW